MSHIHWVARQNKLEIPKDKVREVDDGVQMIMHQQNYRLL